MNSAEKNNKDLPSRNITVTKRGENASLLRELPAVGSSDIIKHLMMGGAVLCVVAAGIHHHAAEEKADNNTPSLSVNKTTEFAISALGLRNLDQIVKTRQSKMDQAIADAENGVTFTP